MPPKPDDFHVIGQVMVANPGVQAELAMREPQGINESILLLDLHEVQRPGIWPQVTTWVQCRFDLILGPDSPRYREVEIFRDGEKLVGIEVEEVQ